MKAKNYYYFVEGENEKKLVQVLKTEFASIRSGKVLVHNALTKPITPAQMRQFLPGTAVIFVFDTDVDDINLETLYKNIKALNKHKNVTDVILIPQVKNIEDELVRSTSIRNIKELLQSKSNKDFKSDFNKTDLKGLKTKLEKVDFSITILWSSHPDGKYSGIPNESGMIKIH